MRVAAALLAVAAIAACSSLPTTGDGIVALQVIAPTPLTLKRGDSLTVRARALDRHGDSVAAAIVWSTPDTAAVTVDATRGVVVAKVGAGTARVQASVGTLHSDLLTIALQP